ncbi:MAG: hypothetical protein IJP27_05380 [Clostridia bacterium]|nr:hypothetical protein [Clostridia bacterium]
MSQENLFDQIKNMDKKERRALLDKVTAALTPEQQKQVMSVVQDKKQMEKLQSNATADDLKTLIDGLNGGDAKDFLNSPQVKNRLKEILG